MMGYFFSLPEIIKCIGDHPFVVLRHAPKIYGLAGGLRPYLGD
jgi:hypothetical protein